MGSCGCAASSPGSSGGARGHVYLALKDERRLHRRRGLEAARRPARVRARARAGGDRHRQAHHLSRRARSTRSSSRAWSRPASARCWRCSRSADACWRPRACSTPARKRPLPFLPEVIGVVTSPTGAVIRDILHRSPTAGRAGCWSGRCWCRARARPSRSRPRSRASTRLPAGGAVPRPDVLIVARGGGSIEDLWAFNEEVVVRAAAASPIPLISAVGHETDTTLIDYVADRRAPTPTAAAEMAVPVRARPAAAAVRPGRPAAPCRGRGGSTSWRSGWTGWRAGCRARRWCWGWRPSASTTWASGCGCAARPSWSGCRRSGWTRGPPGWRSWCATGCGGRPRTSQRRTHGWSPHWWPPGWSNAAAAAAGGRRHGAGHPSRRWSGPAGRSRRRRGSSRR